MTVTQFERKADGRSGTEAGRRTEGRGRAEQPAETGALWRYLEFEDTGTTLILRGK